MLDSGTIDFACPGCDARLRAPLDKAGVRGRCPRCGADLRVPGPPRVATRTFRQIVVGLGLLNAVLALALSVGASCRMDRFGALAANQPSFGTAVLLCMPVTLCWLIGGAVLARYVLKRRFVAGIGLMAHTALGAFYLLALVLQDEAPIPPAGRTAGVLLAAAGVTLAYIVGVESGRRLARREPSPRG